MKRKRLFRREPHVCKQRSRGHWWNGAAELLLHLLFTLNFYWNIFDVQCLLVSGVQQSGSVIHIHISTLFLDYFPCRPLQSAEQSSLCYTIGPYQLCVLYIVELPRQLSGKESTCQCRRCGFNPWIRKIPWRKECPSTPVFLPGEFHRWRSLVGYSPWGQKQSDTTKHAFQLCK